MEVIYTGLHQTPEQIVETAIQEDADAVGISILSGAHMTLVPKILDGLKENGAEDVLGVLGGTIPTADANELKDQGVAEVFTPGAPTSTSTSSAPSLRSSSRMRGTSVMCAPERMEIPMASASSWTTVSTICSGVWCSPV